MYKRGRPGIKRMKKSPGSTMMTRKSRGAITDKEMAMMTAAKKKRRVR